jgi:hypothetical protein
MQYAIDNNRTTGSNGNLTTHVELELKKQKIDTYLKFRLGEIPFVDKGNILDTSIFSENNQTALAGILGELVNTIKVKFQINIVDYVTQLFDDSISINFILEDGTDLTTIIKG